MMSKILIVDDEEDARVFVKEALEGAGFTVDTSFNGEDCHKKIRKNKYDLVLLDMFMPKMSGREIFEQMLQEPYVNKTKVAFFTVARLNQEKVSVLKKMGAVDYIIKPISAKDLVARVKKILG
jgi:DNA-binding response OmpR family regulator